ncbi:ATP-binding protein [Apibacter raozihei]|uniref:sensor histidine kinase n=1 Tax=Apibacter TaxID=1778601 RepID=UPI000FE3D593|nr:MULTISPECIES: ATP-binding protein [Apibacter]
MKLSYKQRIFFYFFAIFALFTIILVLFERKKEKNYKTQTIETTLESYANVINSYILHEKLLEGNSDRLQELSQLLPKQIRITVISKKGDVLFDNDVQNVKTLENHLRRPEIQKAIFQGKGSNVRMSTSTREEYMYYASSYNQYFVRVALPYNIQTEKFFKADNVFLYLTLGMFIIVLFLLNFVSDRFNESIIRLKNYVIDVKNGKSIPENVHFPDDDLGEIGTELAAIVKQKEQSKQEIELEREKLILHFQYVNEGVCIFNPDLKSIYSNSQFIQYLNFIVDDPILDVSLLFDHELFFPIKAFILDENNKENHFLVQINKGKKVFSLQTIKFEDQSFEIIIKDITKSEKTRLIKQEMSNNITHELRTPVASIRAYLETLEEQDLPLDKQKQFINRAFLQSVRLSHLIDDISLISKMEEAGNLFKKEFVNISQLINEVRINLMDGLLRHKIKLKISIDEHLKVNGNYTLLYSVFQNLMENTINYGGENIEIHISNYMEDSNFVYFSYYDTGEGVEEKHLNRLFERFYRVNEGRTRNSGGTGLGLSIVKNAILLHNGEIHVKKHNHGGLEFLFTLKK